MVPDEIFEDEPRDGKSIVEVIAADVSPKDVFVLGKHILIVVAVFLILIGTARIYIDPENGVKEVWEYSKVFLNSVASLVLGYYFGKRDK